MGLDIPTCTCVTRTDSQSGTLGRASTAGPLVHISQGQARALAFAF